MGNGCSERTWNAPVGRVIECLDAYPVGVQWSAAAPMNLTPNTLLKIATFQNSMPESSVFAGSIPALPTPFKRDRIDERALRLLVAWQIEEGSSAVVSCGTTGEGGLLSSTERNQALAICISATENRVPVIAGCSAIGTAAVLEQMHDAEKIGACAALIPAPYYTCPSQDGVVRHFARLATEGGLPIILYNVPTRTVIDISEETITVLALEYPGRIIGIKDATGQLSRVPGLRNRLGQDFMQLSGNDGSALGFMAMGGVGCISVTANVVPGLCAQFQGACARNDYIEARRLNDLLHPLHSALFSDASPGPLKHALSLTRPGFAAEVRLPLNEPSNCSKKAVERALASLKQGSHLPIR
jgi:4-hydroxy-tetrahydrodipicolinate synthase